MKKLTLQRELFNKLSQVHPELGLTNGEISDPDKIMANWKAGNHKETISQESLDLIRELKINRLQYNNLIKKAPYNWVATISGFQSI